jgi:glutamyl-tRNA reductase
MSRLLVKHLSSKGCNRVTVLNRSMPRCEALAEEFPEVEFDFHLMPDLMACVEASDVIFAASGSEEILVHKEDVMGMAPAAAVVRVGGGVMDWGQGPLVVGVVMVTYTVVLAPVYHH